MDFLFGNEKILNFTLRRFFEQSYNSIVITSPDLDVVGPEFLYVNPAFTKMTGYMLDDVRGKTPSILQGPKTNKKVIDRLKKGLKKDGYFHGATTNYKKDGTPYHVEWNISPIKDENDKVLFYISVQKDITALKKMVTNLKNKNEELRSFMKEIKSRLEEGSEVYNFFVTHESSFMDSVKESAKTYTEIFERKVSSDGVEKDEFIDFDAEDEGVLIVEAPLQKRSANEFFISNQVSDNDVEELRIICEEIKDLLEIAKKSDIAKKELFLISESFRRISNVLFYFEEFSSISLIFSELSYFIGYFCEQNQESKSNKIVLTILDALIEDIDCWIEEVFITKASQDIHFFDASIVGSCRQLIGAIQTITKA